MMHALEALLNLHDMVYITVIQFSLYLMEAKIKIGEKKKKELDPAGLLNWPLL